MKIIWDWSLESEAEHIINTARSIANGFFHLHHFYLLPWDSKATYLHQGVYLPTLPYLALPNFWHQVLNYDTQAMSLPPTLADLHSTITSHLTALHIARPDFSNLQAQWKRIAPRFFSLTRSITPYTPRVKSLIIHLTYFGTAGSFNCSNTDPTNIIVYLRIDQPITVLAECILTAITRPYLTTTRHATWEESEFLVDYLLQETKLAKLFPTPHVGILAHLRTNVSATIIKKSTDFLVKIGAPNSLAQTFTLKNGLPHFGNCPLHTLTNRECQIMTKLIKKCPNPATTDELSDLLFPNPNKFSLAALTKCIERLRTKLENQGIPRHYLSTANGVGYYLKS